MNTTLSKGMSPIEVAACADCHLPYELFGIDITLPNLQWDHITEGNKGLLLCANCIARRATRIPGVIAGRLVLEIAPHD